MKVFMEIKKFTILVTIILIAFSFFLTSSNASVIKLNNYKDTGISTNTVKSNNFVSNPIFTIDEFQQDNSTSTLFINGKLSFIYIGGEFCPYCAMERWAIVMALAQFGNFNGLGHFSSAEDNIGTYNFTGSVYSSTKVDFQSVEISNNNTPPAPLQTMDSLQSSLFTKYDGQGAIPFLILGGSVFRSGAGSSLNANSFSGESFSSIQAQVNSKSGPLYNQIHIESTYLVELINQLYNHPVTVQSTTSTPTNASSQVSIKTSSMSFLVIELIISLASLAILYKRSKKRIS